jgi:prepilin-type N-terminal cleavage/methylation domain-containing protein
MRLFQPSAKPEWREIMKTEIIMMETKNTGRGFTLLELVIAMSLGLIVLAGAASLFRTGMNSAFLVAQRAETQQNMRAAIDLMTKDINQAGAGLPSGGIQLPTGAGSSASKYGCDQGGTCYVPAFNYPNNNYLYGIIPGWSNGVQGNAVIPASVGNRNDSITVIYADYNFPLWEYNVSAIAANGGAITVAPNAIYNPAPPAITSPGGIQVGDLILLNNSLGTAVGEVTGLSPTTITFADLDALNINQSGAATNNIEAISGAGANTTAIYRLFAITYYLTVPANGQLPRLMRQVNGLAPVPVADNIINLQFAYDVYNSTTSALDANQANPLGVAESPNLIQKVNIWVMGQSMTANGNKSQSMYLATSMSARNMAFRNRYQ